MLYRMRGSTFQTLLVCNLQPLQIQIPSSGGNLLYLLHLRCSLNSRSIHFLVASPSTGLTRDCVGLDARDPSCSAIAGAAAQSYSQSHPPPPSRKPQPNLAHHHSDMPNGEKALRPQDWISAIPTAAPFTVG
jgi:hypothetical protein